MVWQSPEGIDEYLKPTPLCDSDDEEIKKKARELIKGVTAPKEAALNIFYFVRDEIKYALDFVDVRASHTLKTRLGTCEHKSKLQIALLRAGGIPARYRRAATRKELLRGIFSGIIYRGIPEVPDTHVWCECYLSGKWVSCDALLDKVLFEGMVRRRFPAASQIPTIDWDGQNNLILTKPWVVEDFGAFASLDDLWIEVAKKEAAPRILQRIAMSLSNRHTDNLRRR
jgi:transglutaminase-like putative cysteine protease